MFSQQQLQYALSLLNQLGLKDHVPTRLEDEEAWRSFVAELFSAYGWKVLGAHYSDSPQHVRRQQLLGDMERLQQALRESARGSQQQQMAATEGGAAQSMRGLEWLYRLLQEHCAAGAAGKVDIDGKDTAEAADTLAYEMGQRAVWHERFQAVLSGQQWHAFMYAPLASRAPFKLAFLHAADALVATEGGEGQEAGSVESPLRDNQQLQTCKKMLTPDPSNALAMAQRMLDETALRSEDGQVEALHMLSGDACFALRQFGDSVHHFQHAAAGRREFSNTGLPEDAVIEQVCAMLEEGYPAAQVMHVAEDGCLNEGAHAEGWTLLVKVILGLADEDSEQVAEDRNAVSKLLMLRGSNATNKRERDVRLQRCGLLPLFGDVSGRRAGGNPRPQDEFPVNTDALHEFWKNVAPEERPALCRVPIDDLRKAVLQLAAAAAAVPVDLSLPARLLDVFAHEPESVADPSFAPGLSWSDALCEIRSLAEASPCGVSSSHLLEVSAYGLFCLDGDAFTLSDANPLAPDGDATAEGQPPAPEVPAGSPMSALIASAPTVRRWSG